MLKLNIGGGTLPIDGFKNVDLYNGDIKHDLRTPLPFDENSVDEIMAIHVIESFYRSEFLEIIKDWYRVLKPDCRMTIEFTDLVETCKMFINGTSESERNYGKWGIHGDQTKVMDPIAYHNYVYEREELQKILEDTGFKVEGFNKDHIEHVPQRDWRVICYK